MRPTGVYGPYERDYYLMMKSIKYGFDFIVGFKPQLITFIYVKDLVQAIFKAIDRGSRSAGVLPLGREKHTLRPSFADM